MADLNGELAELLPEGSTIAREGVGINVKRLVKLRTRFMVLTFIAVAVPLLAAVALLVPRPYVATVQIEFNPIESRILTEEGRELSPNTYENYVNTQAMLISGYTILARILDHQDIQELPFAQQDGAVGYLMKHVEAEVERNSQLVTVTYRDADRERAGLILNAIKEEYAEYLKEQESKKGDVRRETLEAKEKEIREDLERQRRDIVQLRKEKGLPAGDQTGEQPLETESYRTNLAQAEADFTTAQTALREAQSLVERTQELVTQNTSNPGAPVFAQGIEDKVLLNPHVTLLLEQLAMAEQAFSELQENFVETAPQVEIAQANLEALQQRVDAAKTRARTENLRSALSQAEYDVRLREANVADASARRDQFQSLLEEHLARTVSKSSDMAEVDELNRAAESTQFNLTQIQAALLDLDIERNAPARANILGDADVPPNPDMMDKLKFAILALLVATTLSVGGGILKELTDQAIRSAQDISYVTTAPVIATIPHTSEDRLPGQVNVAMVTQDFPTSMTSDEFRQVVARIVSSANTGRPIKTCMITSPARGDGKSTLACNLAIVLAQAGHRVLLLDVDSRNPSVERNFGLRPGAGIAEMLSGEQLRHDPDRATDFENLYVMGPGLNHGDLVERLASPEMREFLAGAEQLFEFIILDTPATLITSETRLLTHMADAVIVVVGAGVSSFGMLRRCIDSLESNGAVLLGIVLNAVRQAPGGYLRRNIDLYYSQKGGRGASAQTAAPTAARRAEPSIVLVNDTGDDR